MPTMDTRRRTLARSLCALLPLGLGCVKNAPELFPPSSSHAPRALAAEEPAAPVAIVHAHVWTGAGPSLDDGTVLLKDGRIAAVGPSAEIAVPAGARVVDAGGRWLTPGLIDTHSHLGVYASPGVIAHSDGNEATAPVTAEVSAEHSFWPQDPGLLRAAAGGVTAMLILPGSANLIGGRGFAIKNRIGRSAAAMHFPGARPMLKMACGENPKRVYGERRTAPSTRMGNYAGYRIAFAQARDYQIKWQVWTDKERKEGKPPPPRDLKLETLAEVLDGRIWVQNHCYRADEMLLMLDLADEFGFTIRSFHHALEAYKIRDVLAKRGVAASTWADWWGFKLEAFDGIPENLALVHAAGARAVVHSDSEMGIQRLNQEAGKALASGRAMGLALSDDDALGWITRNPAWVLGVSDQTGTLEVGKMADVVVWSAHPLSVYALADLVLVDGHVVHDRGAPPRQSDFELGVLGGAEVTQ